MDCAVFLNLDGTLTRHDLDYADIYRQAIDAADLSALDGEYETYTDAFFRFFQNGWAYPRRQAIQQVMADHDIVDHGRSDAFATAWEDREVEESRLRDGSADAITTLAERYPVGIATNGTGRLQRMKIDRFGLDDGIDAAIISGEIGMTKPHSGFFDACRAALDADQHVMVSDDLRRDILPAKRAEFLTVWISDEPGNQQVEELVDRRVADIGEVPGAVDDLCGD